MKVLLVEDEPDIRSIVAVALTRRDNFDLTCFDSGLAALDALGPGSNTFDVALVNVRLPVMWGPEFLEKLREVPSFENLPAIFLTASVREDEVARLHKAQTLGILSKPFNPLQLGQSIRELLGVGP